MIYTINSDGDFMNINKISLVAVLLIISLMIMSTGCQSIKHPAVNSNDTPSADGANDIFGMFKYTPCDNSSDVVALAYLGYDIAPEDLNAKIDEKLTGITPEEFSHIRQVELEGDEYYLIVPKYADSTVSVFKSDIETGYDKNAPISSTSGEAVVLKCNVSDIITNSVIEVKYTDEKGSENTVVFSPSLSLKDGEISDSEYVFEYKIDYNTGE